tara:strand:+ start:100 stop:828 length:729 start_codon:yes stop_codon:yes gene_type:complete
MDKNIFKTLLPKGILRAGINMSNFLLVTGKKADGSPDGVSPDLVKQIALDLKVNYELIPFDRPGELADAVNDDIWDIGNIAYEPERANTISFTNPYVLIDANFLIRKNSELKTNKDIDKKGVSIVVAERSAYDLWLTDNLTNAKIIRVSSIQESHDVFNSNKVDVLAGLKPKLLDEVSFNNSFMIINEPFTFVKQSVGFKKGETEVIDFLNNLILKYLKSGVINNLLKKHNVQKKLSLPKIN